MREGREFTLLKLTLLGDTRMKNMIFLSTNLLILLVFPLGVWADPFIRVTPLDHDFGDVEVGSASSAIITISNLDGQDLEIRSVELTGSADFSITSYPDDIVVPTMTTEVEVTFAPSSAGYASAIIEIESNDSSNSTVSVSLGGVGVGYAPPPASVADILAFFDSSVADGTLVGNGPGKSADRRRRALRNMIEAAGDLIDDGAYEDTCRQLLDAYKRCDGLARPPDFVSGSAAPELAGMILELIGSLGC